MQPRAAPLADLPVQEVLERLAARTPGPGAGTAAALTCTLAASLVEMAARFDSSVMAEARVVRASALRERALLLAEQECSSYEPVLDALAMPADNPQREQRLAAARSSASTTPLAIAGVAAQLATLAAESAQSGSEHLIGEAVAAAEIADGACRAAAHLVRINLQG
ncbi:MAG: cyclodeaminase/cyclohydrolase family protein, partial [Solirubrobacteraceae bacterium]